MNEKNQTDEKLRKSMRRRNIEDIFILSNKNVFGDVQKAGYPELWMGVEKLLLMENR